MSKLTRYITAIPILLLMATSGLAGEAEDDFAERCAQSGVVICVGFDSMNEVASEGQIRDAQEDNNINNPQAVPNNIDGRGNYYPSFDSSVAASGNGSMRITANQVSSANQSGHWIKGEAGSTPWPQTFGSGDKIHVQFRWRYNQHWRAVSEGAGGDGNKIVILYGDKSCGQIESTIQDAYGRGFIQGYHHCGGLGWEYDAGDYPHKNHNNIVYQFGPDADDPLCLYRQYDDLDDGGGCQLFDAHHNKWWTIYMVIDIKQNNAHTDIYAQRGPGEPVRHVIDFGPYNWGFNDGPMENLMFTMYHTDKGTGNHPLLHAWYDELIISSEPIAWPGGAAPPVTTIPNPPVILAGGQ